MAATQKRAAGLLLALTILATTSGPFISAQAPQQVGTWSASGAIGDGRSGAASVALSDGTTLLAGGAINGVATNTVLLYDPSTNTLVAAGQLASARVGHTATALEDGQVLVVGGRVGGSPSSDVELFDPSSGGSVVIGQLAGPRTGHAAVRIANGVVAVFGGANADGAVLNTVEQVNVSTGTASAGSTSMLHARAGASATMLIDGRVLVAGGNDGSSDLNSAELYYPWTQAFEPASNRLSAPRSGHSAILLPHNGGVLIAGGNSNGTALATADLFLPAESPDPFSFGINTFVATATMAGGRVGAAAGPGREGYAWVEGGGTEGSETYRFATIKTDKDDYAPGETAVITGTGWMPGEEVRLLFQEDPAVHEDYELRVTADAAGNIYWDQWAPEQHDIGVRFYLNASDSRSRAQTTFTDGNLSSTMEFTITPTSVAPGGTLSWSVTARCVDGGGPHTCDSEGYDDGGFVQDGYQVEIQRATNPGFTGTIVTLPTVTTTNGVVSGTAVAPTSGGPYYYRARHPNQNLGNVPVQGNTTNSWQPTASDPPVQVTLITDATAPTTTLTVGNPKFGVNDRFVTGASTFALSCADSTGCAATFYQLVGPAVACPSNTTEASWVSYSTAFVVPAPDGEVRVCYFSRDTLGNREAPKFQNHYRDTVAPTTTATATANAASYTSGAWTRFNVTLNLNAADGVGEAGVKEITYSATGATTIAPTTVAGASASVPVISAEGTTTVTFFAKDNVNNTETSKTFTVRIDKTAPSIVNLGPTTNPNAAGWYNADVINRFSVTDALSGLDAACLVAFPDDGGSRVQSKTTTGEGAAVTVSSDSCADVAGNVATAVSSAAFKIDKTAPVIVQHDFSPAANAAGWHQTNVTVRFKATDALSGLVGTCAAFLDVSGERIQTKTISTEGTGLTTTSDSCTDLAGNTASAVTSTAFNIDKTAPVIVQHEVSPAANDAGWHHTDVTVRFKATDAGSGLVGTCAAFLEVSGERIQTKTISTEGTGLTTTSDSCTDLAGNTAPAVTSTAFNIDKTAPVIVNLGPLTSPNSNGWYNANVTNRFSVTDALSGLGATCVEAFPDVSGVHVQSKTTTGEGAAVTVSSDTCTDVAGNTATAVTSAAFKIDKTAPVIVQLDVTPAANGAGWHHTDVNVRFKATDAVSGLVGTCAAFLDVSGERIQEKTITGEGTGLTTTSDSCTDLAGNTASGVTSSLFNIDRTAPVIVNLGPLSSPNSNGWYNADVTNRFSVSDGLSGLDAACLTAFPADGSSRIQSKQTNSEGTAVVVMSNSCADVAGNTAAAVQGGPFQIDKTAPVIANLGPTSAPNSDNWYNTDVTNRFRATEGLSGFDAACLAAFPLVVSERIQSRTTSSEGTAVFVTSSGCADLAGNVAAGVNSATFKIDKTAPTVTIASPTTGSTIVLSIAAHGTASDILSGIKTVTLTNATVNYNGGTWATVSNVNLNCGANTLTAVATDYAGLTNSVSVTVTRLCFTFEYLHPLEQSYAGGPTVVNDGKYGRVIPVKGIVRRTGVAQSEADLATLGLTLRIAVVAANCNGTAISDAVEEYSDAGNSNGGTNMFRWTLDGFWIYNLDTKAPPGVSMAINGCYRFDAYVHDAANRVRISESPYAIFRPVK